MFQSNPIKSLFTAALLTISLSASATIPISVNTTWNTSFTLTDQVEIQPGATLTISGTNTVITCSPGIYIRILSSNGGPLTTGGKLVINDATLTGTAGNNGWEGIYIVGNKLLSQQDNRMGRVTLNNALIEKCIYGIRNWDYKYDVAANTTGGGIVQISNSRFHNNTFGVYLHSYRNFSKFDTATKLADASFINKSRFYYDNNNGIPTGSSAAAINMHRVEGVRVQGNTFYCDPAILWGGGTGAIYLESSGAVIQPYCNDLITQYGQDCNNITPNTISNFVKGIYGPNQGEVHAITIDRTQINNTKIGVYLTGYQNTKILRNTINLAPASSSGITLEGCSGFRVEQNVIHGTSTSSNNGTYGITVKNAGESYNEIYKNEISDVNYALQANDNNRSTTNMGNGLFFLCNTLTNAIGDAYDITVTGGTTNLTSGIAPIQAGYNGLLLTAGNTFSSFSTSTGAHNFNNAGNPVLYYVDPAIPATSPAYHNVTLMNGGSNTCPTKIIPPGVAVATMQQLSAFKAELEATIGGKINSGEDYATDLGQYAFLIREMMDRHMGTFNGEETEIHPEALISLLGSAKYLYDFQIIKAGIEAQQGRFDEAMATLEAINDQFELNEQQQSRLHRIKDMMAVTQGLEEAGNNWTDMDPMLRDLVYTTAADDDFAAREMARYYLAAYDDALLQPDLRTVSDAVVGTPVGVARANVSLPVANGIHVYPNPASDRLLISIPARETANATVTDLAGRNLLQPVLKGGLNQLDIHALKPGLYFVTVTGADGKTSNYKIVKE